MRKRSEIIQCMITWERGEKHWMHIYSLVKNKMHKAVYQIFSVTDLYPLIGSKLSNINYENQDFMNNKNFSINFHYTVMYSIEMKRESLNLNIMNHNPDNLELQNGKIVDKNWNSSPTLILSYFTWVSGFLSEKRHQQGFALKITASEKKGLSSKQDPFILLKKHSIKS